jgi:4-hydroxyacetophenone monooxygenase
MSRVFEDATRDEAALRAALAEADIAPTLMVLAHLSGDMAILDEVAPHIHGAWSFLEKVPEELKQKLHDRLVEVLKEYAANGRMPPRSLPAGVLQRIMSAGAGQHVPEEYVPLLIEEMRLGDEDTRELRWRRDPATLPLNHFQAVVIGAGFSGICAGIRLQQAGIPFVILEKNEEVGGTWYENDYPGCGVDTPNHFYSFSFNPNNNWSHHFSKRDEIFNYIQQTVKKYDLRKHIRFGVEVTDMEFKEDTAQWTVRYRDGRGVLDEMQCNTVITGVGVLNRPALPRIEGLEKFSGPCFHTACWDKSVDLKGKRVAMIGTGASAMQAAPAIAPEVARLTIFQRSPHWAVHNPNYHKAVSEGQKWALRNIPFFTEWQRFLLFWGGSDGFHSTLKMDPNWSMPDVSLNKENHKMREMLIEHIRKELDGDEELIAKCIPGYPPYGKRMLRDNHWYKMLKRPNVSLVNDPVSHITESAIVMKDGTVHEVDVIIVATGFQAAKMLWPMDIKGRDGLTIRHAWGDDDPRAYKGITVPGFPNMFVICGPNTALAHGGSLIFHTECQVKYIMQAIRDMVENGYSSVEIRPEVHDRYNQLVDEKCENMVWAHPGVTSWYKNKNNRVSLTSPWRLVDYWRLTQTFDPDEYICVVGDRDDVKSMKGNRGH